MKFLYKIFFLALSLTPGLTFAGIEDLIKVNNGGSNSANIQNDMIPSTNTIMGNSSEINGKGTDVLMPVFTEFKALIFGLLALIAITVFIYLGYKLVIAQGKPDEFKKAMMGFVYAVVGLAIIPLAWAMIKLISSLQF